MKSGSTVVVALHSSKRTSGTYYKNHEALARAPTLPRGLPQLLFELGNLSFYLGHGSGPAFFSITRGRAHEAQTSTGVFQLSLQSTLR